MRYLCQNGDPHGSHICTKTPHGKSHKWQTTMWINTQTTKRIPMIGSHVVYFMVCLFFLCYSVTGQAGSVYFHTVDYDTMSVHSVHNYILYYVLVYGQTMQCTIPRPENPCGGLDITRWKVECIKSAHSSQIKSIAHTRDFVDLI